MDVIFVYSNHISASNKYLELKWRKINIKNMPLPLRESLAIPEAVPASGRVRSFESMWTRKYGFPILKINALVITIISRRKEGNVLFNDAHNTFYLRLYGVRHMVKDHSDSEKGNQLPPHRLLFPISSKGSFICTIPQTG